ncbi:MAG: CBS domain-containing protein [Gammaproteobacteria bacterium]|nr:CBS domain-containing protein [Gammaproteobacteria bacterium]
MRVEDVMERKVITVSPDTQVRDAYAIMQAGGFRHLPVLDGDRLVGILSERDLRGVGANFENPETGEDEFLITRDVSVDEIMVTKPICVSPETSIPRASRIIREKRIGCLLVTEGERLVGILSYLDILDAAIVEQDEPRLRKPEETQPIPRRELQALRQQLHDELAQFRLENPSQPDTPVRPVKPASYFSASKAEREEMDRKIAEDNSRLMDDIASQLNKGDS